MPADSAAASAPHASSGRGEVSPALLRPAVFEQTEGLVAGFSTRAGGVSEGAYRSLNLGLSTDDEAARVSENRRRLGAATGFAPERWVVLGQVHGDRLLRATEPGVFRGYDGLVTDRTGLLLCISAADCAAVLLADAKAGVVGACHSGWRGTVKQISEKTVAEMDALGARPSQIRAYVSPCISTEHFEVGDEVAAQFAERFVRRPADAPELEKPHVDLKAVIASQLHEAGVPEAQIEISPRCTVGEPEALFSHRASGGTTGRMMGFIGFEA
jgi:YfiH family protein